MADETFAELVRTNTPRLYRLALRMTGHPGEAEDIVQEAFLRAHLARSDGRLEGRSTIATWLYRVTVNLALDALRRRQRRYKFLAVFGALPAEAAEHSEARVALGQAATMLRALPPEQAGALVLTQVEGLSNAEAALALGCSEGAIEQRLIRARAALRRRGEP